MVIGYIGPMIENPDEFIPAFAEAGATWISVYQEACVHLDRVLHHIADHGCKPGVVLNPATPVETLNHVLDLVHHVLIMSINPGFGGQQFIRNSLKKMQQLAQIRHERGLDFRIEVDGGVALETIADWLRGMPSSATATPNKTPESSSTPLAQLPSTARSRVNTYKSEIIPRSFQKIALLPYNPR